jgi:hypothetical protein
MLVCFVYEQIYFFNEQNGEAYFTKFFLTLTLMNVSIRNVFFLLYDLEKVYRKLK